MRFDNARTPDCGGRGRGGWYEERLSRARVRLVFAILFVILSLVSGCSRKEIDEVTIGIVPWPGYAVLSYGVEKGFFQQYGVKLRIVRFESEPELHQAYYKGKIHGVAGTLNEMLRIREDSKRLPQVFLIADFSNGPDQVIARGNVQTLADLRDRRVAVDFDTLGIYVLARGLDQAGLGLGDVRLVSMPMREMEHAMSKPLGEGGVDAIVAYPPVTNAVSSSPDTKALFSSAEIPGEVVDIVALETDVLQNNRSLVENMVRAYAKTVKHIRKNFDEAVREMAKIDDMDEQQFREILSGLEILDVCEQQSFFLPNGTLQEALKTSDLVMRRIRRIKGPDKTVGVITFGPVQVVAQEMCQD